MCESTDIPEEVQRHGEGQAPELTAQEVNAALRAQCAAMLPGLREAREAREREKTAEEERVQEQLRAIGKCPVGFEWLKREGGWCCAGGSHFVTDAELMAQFSTNVDA